MTESKKEDYDTIHKVLNIIENMIDIQPNVCKKICEKTKILHWLIKKMKPKPSSQTISILFDDNKLYASEILSILLQNNYDNQFLLGKIGGIEHILQIMAVYIKNKILFFKKFKKKKIFQKVYFRF